MSIKVAQEGMLLGRPTSTQTQQRPQITSPVARGRNYPLEQTRPWPLHDGKAVFCAGFGRDRGYSS
jgi:hypothetical protein